MASKRKPNVIGNPSNEIGIGDRWAHLLREQVYRGPDKAKRIQRDWGISKSMAYVWLSGGKPTTQQIERARELWGDTVIQFLFGRMPLRSLDERLSDVEQQIAALKSGQQETAHGEDHRGAHDALSDLARGSERAEGRMVEEDPGSLIDTHWRREQLEYDARKLREGGR